MYQRYSGGRFLCRSLDAVIFCFLVSFSAVYSSVNIQSYFKLVNKFIQQIWVSFLFSSKYDEGIHNNIHSRHCIQSFFFSEQFVELFLSFFFISNRVTTKPRVKSSNVACTLGRMQSPLLIIIFLCLKLTFQFINFLILCA